MIKKLRIKFILICMLSLLGVLAVIIAGMNIVNYHALVSEADEVLMLLAQNKGRFPEPGRPGDNLPPHMSPEMPYETRYFTITKAADGQILRIDTGRIAAVSKEAARSFALQADRAQGFVEQYRYICHEEGDRQQLIFLDCGRVLDSFRGFLLTSILIALAGFFLVFMLVAILSRRVIKPFAEAYEKQKRFITDAGHELKTPLTIIRADADVLEMELGENEWLEDIQKQTKQLSSLTEELVFLSRLEEAQQELPVLPFSISDAVSETAQSFLAPAQTHGKQLQLSVTPLLSANGNEQAIRQLTSILLDNALKYSPAEAMVTVELEKQGRSILLSVTNPSSQPLPVPLSRLFDRFYRGDSARSTRGYGIGLSIAQAIVAAHGGRLSATEAQPQCLRITAQLPMAAPQPPTP